MWSHKRCLERADHHLRSCPHSSGHRWPLGHPLALSRSPATSFSSPFAAELLPSQAVSDLQRCGGVHLPEGQSSVSILDERQEVALGLLLQDINDLPFSLMSSPNCARGYSVASSRSRVQVLQQTCAVLGLQPQRCAG